MVLVAAPVGALVGAAIAGMLLTGIVLTLFRVPTSSMADEAVLAYHQRGTGLPYGTAIPKLVASVPTMGFGASAGMEGASKWLGGTLSSYVTIKSRSPMPRGASPSSP